MEIIPNVAANQRSLTFVKVKKTIKTLESKNWPLIRFVFVNKKMAESEVCLRLNLLR